MFSKIFKHDVDSGIRKKWFMYLVVMVGAIVFCYVGSMKMQIVQDSWETALPITWGDYLAFLLQGMKVYRASPDNPFLFPVMWILIFLFASYSVLSYPFEDLTTYGQQVLIRCGSRFKWWLSKCAWNMLSTLIYFAIFYGTTILFCYLNSVSITLAITPELLQPLFRVSNVQTMNKGQSMLMLIIFPVIVTLALNLLEMFLGLFLKPFTSFGVIAACLIVSAYYDSGLAIGNYTMFLRSPYVLGDAGMVAGMGLLYVVVISCFSVFGGYLYFRQYDILNLNGA